MITLVNVIFLVTVMEKESKKRNLSPILFAFSIGKKNLGLKSNLRDVSLLQGNKNHGRFCPDMFLSCTG